MRKFLPKFQLPQFNAAAAQSLSFTINRFHVMTAALVFAIIASVMPHDLWAAGGSGDDLGLGELLNWLVGLIQGVLGKILAICAFIIGAIAGILKGSLMFFAVGMGTAIVLFYGPNIILNVFGAGFPL